MTSNVLRVNVSGPLNSVRYTELPEQYYVRIRTEFFKELVVPRTPRSQRTHNERDNGSAKTLGLVKRKSDSYLADLFSNAAENAVIPFEWAGNINNVYNVTHTGCNVWTKGSSTDILVKQENTRLPLHCLHKTVHNGIVPQLPSVRVQ
ncbi:hypothetical protein CEXT_569971 [Caerostris extrusa]|uniref:Uncharacterized protein n=1 Tax=Caerostris extrusa TaxID=172846 RepID=A0AAV4XL08_CAEEX|nr:hypothetical protein CEXT_569971 [Caerostris extrusa]